MLEGVADRAIVKELVEEITAITDGRAKIYNTKDMVIEPRWLEDIDKAQLKRMAVEARQLEERHRMLVGQERIKELRMMTSSRWEVPIQLGEDQVEELDQLWVEPMVVEPGQRSMSL